MPVTLQMVASGILMCGLKRVPVEGPAFEVLDSIKLKHELVGTMGAAGRDRGEAQQV